MSFHFRNLGGEEPNRKRSNWKRSEPSVFEVSEQASLVLYPCFIRNECKWFGQKGGSACQSCALGVASPCVATAESAGLSSPRL